MIAGYGGALAPMQAGHIRTWAGFAATPFFRLVSGPRSASKGGLHHSGVMH